MSAPQHWSKIQERGTLVGMQILLGIYRVAGRRILMCVMAPVVFYFYLSGKQARHASAVFRHRAARFNPQVNTGFWSGYKHFLCFANAAFDKIDAWLGRLSIADLTYTNEALFQQIRTSGRGAIFIGSHLGNLEVCRALNAHKYASPINVLVFTQHAIKFNTLLQKIHPDVSINMMEVSNITPALMIQLRDKIDDGESLVIVGDRTSASVSGRVSYVDFMGQPAPFSQGPFILASLLECPVYLLFCLRENNGYHMIFEHFSDLLTLPRKNRHMHLDEVIARYAQRLAHYAGQYPMQWFNFYDFWQQDESVTRSPNTENN
ncbi:acyltransferase [Alteromonas sp. C1M14]|uniref:LpxL/LpxP family acyltransferase n=1 Tax=Alteromonas sp. C1M14 TaxID=2841567 RepID=UPI001C08372C|nr:acyltransferase [Alteromonas sp. C1M14]MBU2979661.1 acyltransferase [Alteromonas sp. C1M14]